MIKPKALKRGDTAAVVSLSSGMAGEAPFLHRFQGGVKRIEEEFGLKTKIMPHALKGVDFLYHHPEARALDLMEAFLDQDVQAIICAIGGDDAIRLLPYIDFDVIRQNPKVFMGYSDSTINHLMMYKAGVVSFHGPCVMVEFAENGGMHDYTKLYIDKVLFSPQKQLSISSSPQWTSAFYPWEDPKYFNTIRKMTDEAHGFELLQGSGTVKGKLFGGCLEVLQMAVGTELWLSGEEWQDTLLFLETAEDYPSPDQVRYFLRNLTALGVFNRNSGINGLIVGKPLDEKYYEEYKEAYIQVIGLEAKRPDLPILYNVNCSHTAPVCILPYGIQAEINCINKSLTLLETAVL